MSTRETIKIEHGQYHLFTDLLDQYPRPVHLALRGIDFLATKEGITVVIPREWAIALGLVEK